MSEPDAGILECSAEEFYGFGKELLDRGSRLRIRAHGISMVPVIRDGDLVEVVPVSAEKVEIGDVILFRAAERLVAHRVIRGAEGQQGAGLVTQGDNRYFEDAPLGDGSDVIGRIEVVYRGSEALRVDQGLYGVWGKLICRYTLVRRMLLRLVPVWDNLLMAGN